MQVSISEPRRSPCSLPITVDMLGDFARATPIISSTNPYRTALRNPKAYENLLRLFSRVDVRDNNTGDEQMLRQNWLTEIVRTVNKGIRDFLSKLWELRKAKPSGDDYVSDGNKLLRIADPEMLYGFNDESSLNRQLQYVEGLHLDLLKVAKPLFDRIQESYVKEKRITFGGNTLSTHIGSMAASISKAAGGHFPYTVKQLKEQVA